jgi:hypothetical protein
MSSSFAMETRLHGVITYVTLLRPVTEYFLCTQSPDKISPIPLLSDGLSLRLLTVERVTTRYELGDFFLITSSKQSGYINNET